MAVPITVIHSLNSQLDWIEGGLRGAQERHKKLLTEVATLATEINRYIAAATEHRAYMEANGIQFWEKDTEKK